VPEDPPCLEIMPKTTRVSNPTPGALAQSAEFGNGSSEPHLILSSKPLPSFVSDRRLRGAATNCAGKIVKGASVLPHAINYLLRPAELLGNAGKPRERRRNGRLAWFLGRD
jgi:hypothetical protein